MKEMLGGCCVCSDERGWPDNPLVYCDGSGCNVAVHQACYGIVTVPTGPWFCRKCECRDSKEKLRCELCPSKAGALKRSDSGGWAHVVCALYIPEVRFGNVTSMEPIVLRLIPPERYNKPCYICVESGKTSKATLGACMQCNKNGCKQQFHVTCAQSLGLLCEEAGNYLDNVKYCGYCHHHYSKLKKGSNVKTIPPYKPVIHDDQSSDSSHEKEDNTTSETKQNILSQTGKNKGGSRRPSVSKSPMNNIATKNETPAIKTSPSQSEQPVAAQLKEMPKQPATDFIKTPGVSPKPSPKHVAAEQHPVIKTLDYPPPKASTPLANIPPPANTPPVTVNNPTPIPTSVVTESVTSTVPTSVVEDLSAKPVSYIETIITNANETEQKHAKKRKAPSASSTPNTQSESVDNYVLMSTSKSLDDMSTDIKMETSSEASMPKRPMNSTPRYSTGAQSLDQLLERQWEQGSQFLMEQVQHFDIASLLSCLHQLRTENVRLEEHVANLLQRRDHLLAVNARLAIPLNTPTENMSDR